MAEKNRESKRKIQVKKTDRKRRIHESGARYKPQEPEPAPWHMSSQGLPSHMLFEE